MFRAAFLFSATVLATISIAGHASAQTSGRLKTIIEKKTITIAYRPDATPFAFVNESKEPAGYTIDICKAVAASIAKKFNIAALKTQWVQVNAQTRFDAVSSGKADLECGSSTVTLSRMKQVDFSSVVFIETTGVAVKADSGATGVKDLAGKKIAVIAGTTNEKVVAARSNELQLNATIVPVKDRDEAVAKMDSGAADAFANDKLLLVGTQFKNPKALKMLPDDLSIERYAIVLPRGDWELRVAVNGALAQMFRAGEVKNLFSKWFAPIGLQPSLLLGATFALGEIPE